MNRSFENIFEKFNLRREVTRKRHRITKTQSNNTHKKCLPIVESINPVHYTIPTTDTINSSKSYYLNIHSKAKYNIPTRYNKLDIVEVGSEANLQNCSLTEYPLSDENAHNNQNRNKVSSILNKTSNKRKYYTFGTGNVSQSKSALVPIENSPDRINVADCSELSDNEVRSKIKSDTSCEMNETNFLTTENSFHISSPTVNSEDFTSHCIENGSSELDLLIDLIEQEEKTMKNQQTIGKRYGNTFNSDERLLVTKPCLKNGCQEMFERALKHAKANSKFLKYDKKIGLRIGQLLVVVEIGTFYGLTIATVKREGSNKKFAVVVAGEMAQRLKLGIHIEAFFDDHTIPYKVLLNGEYFDVYLDPYKLIMV